MNGPPEMTQFFGHLHPLLVHLPIGLIVLLAFLEWIARYPRFKNANSGACFILALAAPLAVFTAVCGWLLSLGGAYGDRLLQLHFWTGIGTAAACVIAALCYRLDLKRPYRYCLAATTVALVFASHFGGSLTHGSDYLVRFAPQPFRTFFGGSQPVEKKVQDIAQMRAFADVVQPMLNQDCVSCHGPAKSESQLRLDSLAAVLKGAKSGPTLVAGKSSESSLLKRLHLPLSQKEHMPPEGKPQPDADQVTLLQWWIDAGAPAEKTVGELKPPARILRTLQARYGDPALLARKLPPKPLNEVQPLLAKLTDDLNVVIAPLSPGEPWLQCNASIAGTNFGDADLAKLAPIGANLRWLDLAGTKVGNAGLSVIAAMPNLTRLHLERTSISDAGLARLANLGELEYLNLYGTEVTDLGLPQLQSLPKLKLLYLWQTKVTPAAAQAFAELLTDADQLQRWQDEIAQLKFRIRNDHVSVELGAPGTSAPGSNAAPLNAQCPVSGKPVDQTKTLLYEGTRVAFCCDDCKAKFEQDPKPFVSKLHLTTASETKAGKK